MILLLYDIVALSAINDSICEIYLLKKKKLFLSINLNLLIITVLLY